MRITENQEVMVNFLGANLTKIVKHSNDSSETVTKCLSVFDNLFGLEFKRLKGISSNCYSQLTKKKIRSIG